MDRINARIKYLIYFGNKTRYGLMLFFFQGKL